MKRAITYSIVVLFFSIPMFGKSQNRNGDDYDKNILKINLTGIFLKNYGIQYERMLTRKTSFALGLSTMPNTTIPYYEKLELDFEDFSPSDLTVGNYAITPEIRFYMGKNEGARGFYFAPYFRYANHDIGIKKIEFTFEDPEISNETIVKSATLSGNIKGMSAGAMVGAQWKLGNSIYLDWWIAGASYGKSNSNLSILTPINADEIDGLRTELQGQLDEINTSNIKTTLNVNSEGASVDIKGPWASLRAGLLLGFRF
jgi:hypothetical protein